MELCIYIFMHTYVHSPYISSWRGQGRPHLHLFLNTGLTPGGFSGLAEPCRIIQCVQTFRFLSHLTVLV